MNRTDVLPLDSPVVNRLQPTIRTVAVVEPQQPPVTSHMLVVALVGLVLFGGGLRAAAFSFDRSLWLDESMLALNLVHRTPAQLLEPLDYNQGAPVGFLLACKACVEAFGSAEWSLRLVPFIGSLAGLIAFAWVARKLLPAPASVLAVALLAFSPHLISYSAECKQYATDAAIAVSLLAISLGLLVPSSPSPRWGEGGSRSEPDEGSSPLPNQEPLTRLATPRHPLPNGERALWRWGMLSAVGALVVWCSHPAAFVLGGIGTALLTRALVERDRAKFFAAGFSIGCWLASFGVFYFMSLKQLGGNTYLTDYWAGHFLSLPPKSLGDLAWIVDHAIAFFTVPGGFGGSLVPLGGLAAALALIGLREFARERWPIAVALAVPVLLVLVASGLHKYPIGGRLMLFLVPLAVLLVASGAWIVFDTLKQKNRFAAIALLSLIVLAPLWEASEELRKPTRHEQLQPVLKEVRSEIQPGDCVYVYYGAGPAFTFYTREQPLPAQVITLGAEHRGNLAGYRAELAKLRGRVWVIVSHRHADEETVIRTTLDARGPCQREIKRPGAAAYLYELE
ncbi:MAG: glycosyltransferase family 39 protein [Planctomycetia bacterium]|nr:glycosyltransferase family 39 protein [Planctomycetia bacterium]